MKQKQTWLFEGEQRTQAEIREMVPAIKAWETIRRFLDMGMTTRREMLSYDSKKAMSQGGKRGYAKTNGNNLIFGGRG